MHLANLKRLYGESCLSPRRRNVLFGDSRTFEVYISSPFLTSRIPNTMGKEILNELNHLRFRRSPKAERAFFLHFNSPEALPSPERTSFLSSLGALQALPVTS